MTAHTAKIRMKDMAQQLTLKVEVTGVRRWQVRVWIATQLIRVVATIAQMRCSIVRS
jgi:hypothetical protein